MLLLCSVCGGLEIESNSRLARSPGLYKPAGVTDPPSLAGRTGDNGGLSQLVRGNCNKVGVSLNRSEAPTMNGIFTSPRADGRLRLRQSPYRAVGLLERVGLRDGPVVR